MRKKQYRTPARSAAKLLCSLLGLVLVTLLTAECAFSCFLSRLHAVSPPLTAGSLPVFSLAVSAESTGSPSSLSQEDSQRDWVNILLIGQDRREGESGSRSDSMILCSYSRHAGQLTLTSFLRDLYVPIPGHRSNRINAAYAFGGRELLKQTVEENFCVPIDGCIEVDFTQFAQIIDLLGGVTLTLRQDEARIVNRETGSCLTEGTQTLTGIQALAYARIRCLDPDGDFSRTDRQRKVMQSLVDSYRKAGPSRLLPLLNRLLSSVSTDLSRKQFLALAMEVIPQLSDIRTVSRRIPEEGTFRDDTVDGMAVLVADLEKARQLLQDIAK